MQMSLSPLMQGTMRMGAVPVWKMVIFLCQARCCRNRGGHQQVNQWLGHPGVSWFWQTAFMAKQAAWVGISWQSWSEGRAWQWLDACRGESYTAGSCWWWCLEYLWVCGMGVRTVQGRHACQMLSIWYAKTPLSWNESKLMSRYIHCTNMYIHAIYIEHTCT